MILKGDFQSGERISELPLVATLGVSRTPIRLALERLAHEGLLEPYPTGGFIVGEVMVQGIWDGIHVRGPLEKAGSPPSAGSMGGYSGLVAPRKCHQPMYAIWVPD